MTDKKLTDEEIIKALECCLDISPSTCKNCPLFNITNSTMVCSKIAAKFALDLINRLQAEIERLKKSYLRNQEIFAEQSLENERLKAENERLQNTIIALMGYLNKIGADKTDTSFIQNATEFNAQLRAEIKSEAYKEFVERLKEHAYLDSGITGFQEMVVDLSDIENIAYELVGEDNASKN